MSSSRKRLTRAFSSRIAAGHKEPNAALLPKNLTRTVLHEQRRKVKANVKMGLAKQPHCC